MKRIIALTAVFAATLAFTAAPILACGGNATTASAKYTCSYSATGATTASYTNCRDNCKLASGQYAVATMKVDGMTCGGCEARLTGEFMKSEGILWVASVSSIDGSAKVIYDKSNYSEKELVNVVSSAGFSGSVVPAVAVSEIGSINKLSNIKSGRKACGFSGNTSSATSSATCAFKNRTTVTNTSGVRIASASKSNRSCCAAGLAKKAKTNASFTSAKDVSSNNGFCAELTSAEHAAFCAQFCSTKSDDTKKSL